MFLEGERQSGDSRSFFFYFCKNYDASVAARMTYLVVIGVCLVEYNT